MKYGSSVPSILVQLENEVAIHTCWCMVFQTKMPHS